MPEYDKYVFPAHAKAFETFDQEEFEKLEEEVEEAACAYTQWRIQKTPENELSMLKEVFDVMHVCETLLRQYEGTVEPRWDLGWVAKVVASKNDERGYYPEGEYERWKEAGEGSGGE